MMKCYLFILFSPSDKENVFFCNLSETQESYQLLFQIGGIQKEYIFFEFIIWTTWLLIFIFFPLMTLLIVNKT